MCSCFELPTYNTDPNSDKFHRVRRFWDALRDAFFAAIVSGHILCLDESMVKWLGQGMPGFMVVKRKPTPKGLELHTLCDGHTGIMIYFEVYEGKIAMSTKEYTRERATHVALTLRMLKPLFGKVWSHQIALCSGTNKANRARPDAHSRLPCAQHKVLIADSWFGSVPCAAALHENGVYAIMNVKTCHKGYPKEDVSTPSKLQKRIESEPD